MEDDTAREILEQLRKANRLGWGAMAVLIIVVCVYIPFAAIKYHRQDASDQSKPSWHEVSSLMDTAQYDKAMEMTQALIEKSPNYYYGHSFLGAICLAKG